MIESLLILFGGQLLEKLLSNVVPLDAATKIVIKDALGFTVDTVEELIEKLSADKPKKEDCSKCVQNVEIDCTFAPRKIGGLCWLHTQGRSLSKVKYKEYKECAFRGDKNGN